MEQTYPLQLGGCTTNLLTILEQIKILILLLLSNYNIQDKNSTSGSKVDTAIFSTEITTISEENS